MAQREIIILDELKISTRNETYNSTVNMDNEPNFNFYLTKTRSTAPRKENWGWSGERPMFKSLHYFLTKETFSMAVKIFRFSAFLKCVPFELESKNGENLRVRPFEKKWQSALWHIVSWIMFAVVAFQYMSFGFLLQSTSFGKEMALHLLYVVFAPWILVYFLSLYRNPRACIAMLNHHDEIMRNSSNMLIFIQGLGLSRKHWASHPFVILAVYYVAWAFIIFDLVLVVFYLRDPEQSRYIYSAFPSSWKQGGWILYMVCALFEFFWLTCGAVLLCLFLCFWCADIYTFNGSLNQLRARQELNEHTIESFLFLQLYCVSFNDFNAGLFCTGFCFVVAASPVLLIYISLTAFDLLSIIVYLAFPVFAAIMIGLIVLLMPQSSKVQIKSVSVLDHFVHLRLGARPQNQSQYPSLINLSHLTDTKRRGYLRRRAKAFRRLRIQISFFGAFSLDTSAVMMDQIINNILLLLSL